MVFDLYMNIILQNDFFSYVPQRQTKILSWMFIFISIVFLLFSIYIACVNNNPGSPDSKSNLDIARNFLRGEGFTSHMVIQHFVKQALPNPEVIRNPGVPYLLAGLFRIFSINLAIPVIINAIVILLSAWMLRSAASLLINRIYGDIAGILMLLSSNYELISILNNNFLVLCTIILLYLSALLIKERINSVYFVLLSSLLTAIGFYIKYTFVLTSVPVVVYLLLLYKLNQEDKKLKVSFSFLLFSIITLILCSPILLRNYSLYGKVLYTPITSLRLAERYSGPELNAWRWVHFDGPVTLKEMMSIYGRGSIISKELIIWIKIAVKIILLNAPLFVLLIASLFMNRRKGESVIFVVLLLSMIEPVFSVLYWRQESRYMWSIYPCLILLTGMLLVNLNMNPRKGKVLIANIVSVLLIAGIINGIYGGFKIATESLKSAEYKAPGWVEVAGNIEAGSVIITNDPWSVAWYSGKYAVIYPIGTREDLMKVVEIYKPDYYLNTGEGFQGETPQFLNEELELIAGSDKKYTQWFFYKIKDSKYLNDV